MWSQIKDLTMSIDPWCLCFLFMVCSHCMMVFVRKLNICIKLKVIDMKKLCDRLTWSVCLTVHVCTYLCIHLFVCVCSSSLLWIHWGSTLTWLLMASRLERQMWSFAPMKMLWQPCPKTRTTCVCPLIFLFSLSVLQLILVTTLFPHYITFCSWHNTTCWLTAQVDQLRISVYST